MKMESVSYVVERETEKAVQICVFEGHFEWQSKYIWLPKSACEFQEFVATVNPCTNQPETYGKRVVAVAKWLAYKNKL